MLREEKEEGYRPHFSGNVPLPPDRPGQGKCEKIKMKNAQNNTEKKGGKVRRIV